MLIIYNFILDLIKMINNFRIALSKIALIILEKNSSEHKGMYPQMATFAFDYISNCIQIYGRYEKSLLEKLKEVLEKNISNSLIIDVGANIGNHSLYFSTFFQKVIALEPNPKVFKLLKVNSSLTDNIECLNVGASSEKGILKFYVDDRNLGGSRIIGPNDKIIPNSQIDVVKIDDIEFKGLKPTCIKIDVEGHEWSVIKGCEALIAKHSPIVVFEQEASEIKKGTSRTIELLKSFGYDYFYTIESRKSLVSGLKINFIKFPLEIIEIILFGDKNSIAELKYCKVFKEKKYNMIISSKKSIEI